MGVYLGGLFSKMVYWWELYQGGLFGGGGFITDLWCQLISGLPQLGI